MSDDVFMWVRVLNFAWGFGLFLFIVWYGVLDLTIARKCPHTHIPPEMRFWQLAALGADVSLLLSLGEIFLKDVTGGYRVFFVSLFLLPATIATKEAIFRIHMHSKAVANGDCDWTWDHLEHE